MTERVAVRARYVLTAEGLEERRSIILEGDRVAELVGWGEEKNVDRIVERSKHIALPGFVDCHTHTQQILLRGSIEDEILQLPPIWTEYLIPFERMLDDYLAYLSSLLSIANMIENGTTFFVEAGAPNPDALIRAMKETGMAGAASMSTFDAFDDQTPSAKENLKAFEALLSKGGNGVEVWGSIREIMMASEDLLRGLTDLVKNRKVGITYHLGEYQGEVDFSLTKYGKRPLEVYDSFGITDIKPSVIAHGIYFSDREREILVEKDLPVSWCPTVDSILMGPHWAAMFPEVRLCIGSDGGAFTNLDLLREIKVARSVAKALAISLRYEKTAFSNWRAITSLTGDFGRAVGHENTLLAGSEANITIVDLSSLLLFPSWDPLEAVISFAGGSNISDTIVKGRFLKENGIVKTVDLDDLSNRLEREKERLMEILEGLRRKLPIES